MPMDLKLQHGCEKTEELKRLDQPQEGHKSRIP
jgi:hypothetical protein